MLHSFIKILLRSAIYKYENLIIEKFSQQIVNRLSFLTKQIGNKNFKNYIFRNSKKIEESSGYFLTQLAVLNFSAPFVGFCATQTVMMKDSILSSYYNGKDSFYLQQKNNEKHLFNNNIELYINYLTVDEIPFYKQLLNNYADEYDKQQFENLFNKIIIYSENEFQFLQNLADKKLNNYLCKFKKANELYNAVLKNNKQEYIKLRFSEHVEQEINLGIFSSNFTSYFKQHIIRDQASNYMPFQFRSFVSKLPEKINNKVFMFGYNLAYNKHYNKNFGSKNENYYMYNEL